MKKHKIPDCLTPFDSEFLSLPLIYREGRAFNFMSESVPQDSTNGASILSPHAKQEAPLLTKRNLNRPCCVHNAGEYWSQRSQKPWVLGQRLEERLSQNTILQSTLDGGEALPRNHWRELSLTTAVWAHLEEVTGLERNSWPTARGKNSVGTPGNSMAQTVLGKEHQTGRCIRNTLDMYPKRQKQITEPYPQKFWFSRLAVCPNICISKSFGGMLRRLVQGLQFEKQWPSGSTVL